MQLLNGSGWPWRHSSGWPWRQRKKEEKKRNEFNFLLRLKFSTKKISRNALTGCVMGAIFLMSVCLKEIHTKSRFVKMRGRNYVAQIRACSKSVLGSQNRPVRPLLLTKKCSLRNEKLKASGA